MADEVLDCRGAVDQRGGPKATQYGSGGGDQYGCCAREAPSVNPYRY